MLYDIPPIQGGALLVFVNEPCPGMRLTEAKMASLLFTLDILVYLEKRQVGILMFAKPTKGSGIVFLVLFPYNYFSGINQKTKLLGIHTDNAEHPEHQTNEGSSQRLRVRPREVGTVLNQLVQVLGRPAGHQTRSTHSQ
ncbi:hypothetical protein CIB48_g3744 [Xylaria polymorpha]|nr:hypothetical protein CIB48_g3744 [Xylaria polymorpha]